MEHEPQAAVDLAGDQIAKLRLFAEDLATRGEPLGLIGPLEPPRIWTRHVLNSALLAPLISERATVVDVGTGGGMPGLVLGIVRPDVQVHCVEPMERRCAWLNEQKEALKLENVIVHRGRAEEYHGALQGDYVTARAVSALKKLVPLTAPLARDGGELLFLKGESVDNEIAAASSQLKKFGLKNIRIEILGEGQLSETTRVFRATVKNR